LSNNRRRWERAVALLCHQDESLKGICRKLERSRKTIKEWGRAYLDQGLDGLNLSRTRSVNEKTRDAIATKKERLSKLIHELPSLHGINRASWSLKTLSAAYEKVYGTPISRSMVSAYFIAMGYKFKKARKVLTSPDPEFRMKLAKITKILSNLNPREKFFSIDEFGPCAIKIKGGRAFVPGEVDRTIPQRQKSKGSLICTAALELSSNQVTHFYSKTKNTNEMIRMLDVLLEKYTAEDRIFLSWDAASWHVSKQLNVKVNQVNDDAYRQKHKTPLVQLTPLPVGSQFLNVIESVFSGMAKAVIHNSDYQSVDECKQAIDRYFLERNEAYAKNPKRAGKKIWGNEKVEPVFNEANNCKDPRWR